MLKLKNPSTGHDLPSIDSMSASAIPDVVSRARAAFRAWRLLPLASRGEYLLRAATILDERSEQIARTITLEMGRVISESRGEVKKAAAFLRYFAQNAEKALTAQEIPNSSLGIPGKMGTIHYTPRGVVALIKPWNAPVQQIVWGLGPALMVGCVVIVKPSEFTPTSALELQNVFEEAGIPEGVLQTIIGDSTLGAALVESQVDMISFTGSRISGCKVAEAAGRRGCKTVLELSGKNSSIVDVEHPSLDLVVPGLLYGSFSNCGQWCSSIERIFVHENSYRKILGLMSRGAGALKVGDGMDPTCDVGPLANERQFRHVKDLVSEAVAAGATVVAGGSPLKLPGHESGYFFAPTILADVPADCRINKENIFGPVTIVHRYTKLEQAISEANSTIYGLGISVWTSNPKTAESIVRDSDSGMVWINEGLQSFAACPWSVTKGSGYGTELGVSGYREFCFEKVVQSQFEGNESSRAWYFPYQK